MNRPVSCGAALHALLRLDTRCMVVFVVRALTILANFVLVQGPRMAPQITNYLLKRTASVITELKVPARLASPRGLQTSAFRALNRRRALGSLGVAQTVVWTRI